MLMHSDFHGKDWSAAAAGKAVLISLKYAA